MATTKATPPKKAKAPAKTPVKPATPAASGAPDPAAQAAATRKNHKVIIILAIIAAVIFLVLPAIALTVGGIFLGKKINENGIKFDANNKSVTVKDEKGNEFSVGEGQKLPADFPAEIKIYPGEIISAGRVNVDDKAAWTVTVKTSDTPKQVGEALTSQFSAANGWTPDSNNNMNDGGQVSAGNGTYRITAFYSSENGKTGIIYAVRPDQD